MGETLELASLVSLKGRRALITGAASGIGEAIAQRYAEAGAELDLLDVNAANLASAAESLRETGATVHIHVVDLSKKAEVDALWEGFGEDVPDTLVNNAGIYPFKHFVDTSEQLFRQVMEVNLFSVTWMCQHMIRLRKDRGGVIVNLGSIEALLPFKDDLSHYSVSKAGVIALTRALAREHARKGFRVNAILPGGILTRGTREAAKRILRLQFGLLKTGYEFVQRLPVGRVGRPDEVARMALVLASDLASYVHGAAIPVDGGFLTS